MTSNWVGLCVLGAIISLISYFALGNFDCLLCAITCGLIIPPLAHIYSCDEGWPRAVVIEIAAALGFLATVILVSLPIAHVVSEPLSLALRYISYRAFFVFIVGAVVAQFAINALLRVRPRPGSITTGNVWIIGGSFLALGICLFACFSGYVILAVLTHVPAQ